MHNARTCSGFTLMEVLLAVALLAFAAAGVAAIHVSGVESLDEQADRMLLDGKIRSRMERLIGADFATLSDGSEPVTVGGTVYTIAWTVQPVDLDGDATPEPTAKQVTVGISTGGASTILNRVVNSNDGDAEEADGGGMALNNTRIELGQMRYVGVRFANLTIPQGANVTEAYVQFRAADSNTENTDLTIYGEDTDDASTFGAGDSDISNRQQTTASVTWNNVPNWTLNQSYSTPGIVPIIQEIVNRPSWSSGNAMALLLRSTNLNGKRIFVAHDDVPANSALLHVAYGSGSTPSLRTLTTIIVDNEGRVGRL